MGWIFTGKAMHHDTDVLRRYVPDLSKDPFHVALTKWHWVPQVVVGLAFLAFGGMPYVLWAVFFRTTFGLHATWLVNSATHLWGSRRFKTRDDSTNNWWVALLDLRRGLAQQPPRAPGLGAARPGVVRVRHQLDRHPHAADARPGVGRQGGQARTRPPDAAADQRRRRYYGGRTGARRLDDRADRTLPSVPLRACLAA